jgi:colicin V production protein
MGEEFWWFYDVIAAAAVLICIYISERKGLFRSALSIGGYLLAFALAISVSGSLSDSIYKNAVRDSNVKKIEKSVSSVNFVEQTANHIESLGYNVNVKEDKLAEIYNSGENFDEKIYKYVNSINAMKVDEEETFYKKLHEGYAFIIKGIVAENLTGYAAESAENEIISHPEAVDDLIPLFMEKDDHSKAAQYIADTYTEKTYKSMIRIISFIALFAAVALLAVIIIRSILRNTKEDMNIAAYIFGGFAGIIKGAAIVVLIASVVRLNVILGNDDMLFFNVKAIDKTYIFKYVYDFIASKM